MSDLDFFEPPPPLALEALALEGRAEISAGTDSSRLFRPTWSLNRAGRDDVAFVLGDDDRDDLTATRAGACFVRPRDRSHVPAATIALITDDPLDAFRRLIVGTQHEAPPSRQISDRSSFSSSALLHATARCEAGVSLAPGTIVGAHVEIGSATSVDSHSVIGTGVRIGRESRIGAHVTIRNALVGDRVIIHDGAQIGTAAPGGGAFGSRRTPRCGRVIIQDDAEVGPNAVIDRGISRDTLIGDGARIGALVLVEGGQIIDRRWVVQVAALSSSREIG